jgi:hypothetical protein
MNTLYGKMVFGFESGVSGVFLVLLCSCMSSAADGHVALASRQLLCSKVSQADLKQHVDRRSCRPSRCTGFSWKIDWVGE